MTDACINCECEAVDTEEWYFNKVSMEYICPWCVQEMHKLKEHKDICYVDNCYCIGVDFNK